MEEGEGGGGWGRRRRKLKQEVIFSCVKLTEFKPLNYSGLVRMQVPYILPVGI